MPIKSPCSLTCTGPSCPGGRWRTEPGSSESRGPLWPPPPRSGKLNSEKEMLKVIIRLKNKKNDYRLSQKSFPARKRCFHRFA